jgi:hypothetical protein
LQVEGSDCRWRGAIAGGGEQRQVEGSDRRWREVITCGGRRLQVEGRDRRWRGAIAGGEASERKWREAIASGLRVGSDRRWRLHSGRYKGNILWSPRKKYLLFLYHKIKKCISIIHILIRYLSYIS